MSIQAGFSRCCLTLALTAAMALTLFPIGAFSQANEGGQYRIAVVDMSLLMAEYNKRKEKYDELQKEVDRLQVEIDAMSQRIEKAKEEYEANRANMTDDERFDKRAQIESDFGQYRSELERRQRLIDTQEERVLKEVVTDIEKVLTGIAEKEGYHLVLNASKGPRASVLYHSATIDITPRILEELNK
ncbi:MAG TPA: OmpH family outer membrane protein [Candidatus Hydrogenedentes bacterium]|nr:OmpH family outer membrane protein [Candidatus Hydrogenedentota bacterium]